MKKALAYVKTLRVEDLDENGLSSISADMDNFSPKEQFEVLLVIFARFLGTIGGDTHDDVNNAAMAGSSNSSVHPGTLSPGAGAPGISPDAQAGLDALKKEAGFKIIDPVADLALQSSGATPDMSNLSDTELQRALSDLPAEADYNETHKATVRAYRARFARK